MERPLLLLLRLCAVLGLLVSGTTASLQDDWPDMVEVSTALPLDDALSSGLHTPPSLDIADIVDPFTSFTAPSTSFLPRLTAEGEPFDIVPLSNSPSLSPSLHDFLLLGLTGGHSDSFVMSGLVHTQLQGAPSTFTDVYLTVHDYSLSDSPYNSSVQMNVTCGNGTLTWLDVPQLMVLSGDAAVSNGSLTFVDVEVMAAVPVLNEAMATFTFTPSTPQFYGNASCAFSVIANGSTAFVDAFVFVVLPTVGGPTPNSVQVSFNLSIAPPLTSQFSVYTEMAAEIAAVLETDADRVVVVSVDIHADLNYTAVLVDFLPVPGSLLASGSRVNDSAEELAVAFVALTPAAVAGTMWLQYAQVSTAQQLCADGVYRPLCSVAIPVAAAAAAVAVTSSIGFIVGISTAVVAVVAAAAASTAAYRRLRKRRAAALPTSPMLKSSSAEARAELQDEVPTIVSASPSEASAEAVAVAIQEHSPLSAARLLHSARASLALAPSSAAQPLRPLRRGLKRTTRATLRGAVILDGASRLERDLLEKLREEREREGRRFVYQPSVVVNDRRAEDAHGWRESLMREMERGRGERERGSVISRAYDSFEALSHRSSLVSPSQGTTSAYYVPPILAPRGHLQYARGEDSDDDDSVDADGPRFLDATIANVTEHTSPATVSAVGGVDVADIRSDVSTVAHSAARPGASAKADAGDAMERGRTSEHKGRASRDERGSLRRLGSAKGTGDGHIGYHGAGLESGSNSRSPSLSLQDVVSDWLSPADELDHAAFQHLSSLALPSVRPPLPLPAVEALPAVESKRRSWSAANARRASSTGKGQRIVLDLSMAGVMYPAPAQAQRKGKDGAGATGADGGEVKGWTGAGGSGAPLMKPLMANAMPHERMSFYQSSVY